MVVATIVVVGSLTQTARECTYIKGKGGVMVPEASRWHMTWVQQRHYGLCNRVRSVD